jgi:menaquinone-dependent protoporphyrinogen oxidase
MEILVVVASRHGSTREIADAMAARLEAHGHAVTVADAEDAPDATVADAVIVGSAIYAGSWREEARAWVADQADVLRSRPVWLFSSGPLGDPPAPTRAEPLQLEELTRLTGAEGHVVFAGALERDHLHFGERMVVRMVGAPYGDFRDWAAVDAWVDGITDALSDGAAAPALQ